MGCRGGLGLREARAMWHDVGPTLYGRVDKSQIRASTVKISKFKCHPDVKMWLEMAEREELSFLNAWRCGSCGGLSGRRRVAGISDVLMRQEHVYVAKSRSSGGISSQALAHQVENFAGANLRLHEVTGEVDHASGGSQ